MPIASFQNKVFSVSSSKKYPVSGLLLDGGNLETEAQEKLKEKPSTYIKGESLGNMSFEIPLRADFGINPRKQIEEWDSIKSKAQPAVFILGTRPIGKNKWLLQSVSASDIELDGHGNMLKASLKLEFKEYVRAGKASKEANETIGTSNSSIKPSQDIFNPADKVAKRRQLPRDLLMME